MEAKIKETCKWSVLAEIYIIEQIRTNLDVKSDNYFQPLPKPCREVTGALIVHCLKMFFSYFI